MIFNRTAYCNAFIPTFSSPQSSPNSVMVSTNLLSFFSFLVIQKPFKFSTHQTTKALAFVLGNTPTLYLRNPLTIIYIC